MIQHRDETFWAANHHWNKCDTEISTTTYMDSFYVQQSIMLSISFLFKFPDQAKLIPRSGKVGCTRWRRNLYDCKAYTCKLYGSFRGNKMETRSLVIPEESDLNRAITFGSSKNRQQLENKRVDRGNTGGL